MSYIIKEEAEAFFRNLRKRMNPKDYKTAREFDFVDSVLLNAEQFIHLMPKQDVIPAPKWISVNERLPQEIGLPTLVIVDGEVEVDEWEGNRGEVIVEGDGFRYETSGWYTNTACNVTHWMPLSVIPKEI